MRVDRSTSRAVATFAAIVFGLTSFTAAQGVQRDALSKIRIKNFGVVNENFYRGAQPKSRDFPDLAAIGVKAVIDLQEEGESSEQQQVESAGMKFYRVGLSDKSWPSETKASQFLAIVNNPANQPVFIHCHGGKHRAGVMTAIYRMTHDKWSADQAYAEMKQYDFESGFGHGTLRDYVYDYAQKTRSAIAVDANK